MSSPTTESSPSSTINWKRTSPSDSRPVEILQQIDVVAHGAELRGHLPGLVAGRPKVGPGDLFLELGPAFPEAVEPQVALGFDQSGRSAASSAFEIALFAGPGGLVRPRHGTA